MLENTNICLLIGVNLAAYQHISRFWPYQMLPEEAKCHITSYIGWEMTIRSLTYPQAT